MITSAQSKNSNSSGFIIGFTLQKFYEMICKIIVSKTICGNFLIFCRLSFINNFMVKNNILEPENHRKLNISKPIHFIKISPHCFAGLICTNKLEEFFFEKNFFQGLGAFFMAAKPLTTNHYFFLQKINFILFFEGVYLILI